MKRRYIVEISGLVWPDGESGRMGAEGFGNGAGATLVIPLDASSEESIASGISDHFAEWYGMRPLSFHVDGLCREPKKTP